MAIFAAAQKLDDKKAKNERPVKLVHYRAHVCSTMMVVLIAGGQVRTRCSVTIL